MSDEQQPTPESSSDETTEAPAETDSVDPGEAAAEISPEDVAQWQSEREDLRRQVEVLQNKPAKRRRTRRIVTAVLVILSILALSAATPGVFLRRTLVDTDSYVALVEDLPSDPAVQDYLARTVTDAVFQSLGVQAQLESVLGDADSRLTFLAGPISSAVKDFVQSEVQKLIASPEFSKLWTEANRFAQSTIVAVLSGDSGDVVSTADGQVVLNLLPIINAAIESVSTVASDLVGQDISIPPITADTVPSDAIASIEAATGVDLPDEFGQIVLVDGDQLAAAQDAFRMTNVLAIALGLSVVLFAALALWVSTRRRRTLLQISTAWIIVLVVERRLAIATGDQIVSNAKPENSDAASAVVNTVVSALLNYTELLLWILGIIVFVAVLTGPYPWVLRFRAWVSGLWASLTGMARDADRDAATEWIAGHRDLVLIVDALVVVALLALFDVSLGWFLVIAGLGGLVALGAWRLADSANADDEAEAPEGTEATAPSDVAPPG